MANPAITSPLFTLAEAAAACGMSPRTFTRRVRPILPCIRVGTRIVLFEKEDVGRFLAGLPLPLPPPDADVLAASRLDLVMAECDGRKVGSIYFVRGAHGTIKIGKANDVAKRLRTLQASTAYPLTVLATMPGSLSTEAALHRKFAKHRLSGEWFRPAPELLRFIEALP